MGLWGLQAGQTVAGYRLVRPLGEGGMASVWLVVPADTRFGEQKEFALKLVRLDETHTNQGQVDALVNEGRAVSRIRHTNVVSLYRLDSDERFYIAAMEYIAGITFRDLIARVADRGVSMPPSLVVDLALGACRGLGAAHEATDSGGRPLGLVHRDVKPSNLMLSEDGTVKVVDFGIAKATTNLGETSQDLTKGTPHYMAPEQWRHEKPTPASDLFSLGAVMSELVTGRVLYQAPDLPQIVTRLLTATARQDSSDVRRRFPALGPVVERCLERRPADRYEDAGDLEKHLLQVRDSLATPVDLAVVARLLGLGRRAGAPPVRLRARDPAWRTFVEAFGDLSESGIPSARPTPGPAPGPSGPPPRRPPAEPVSVPTLAQRVDVPVGGPIDPGEDSDELPVARPRRDFSNALVAVVAFAVGFTVILGGFTLLGPGGAAPPKEEGPSAELTEVAAGGGGSAVDPPPTGPGEVEPEKPPGAPGAGKGGPQDKGRPDRKKVEAKGAKDPPPARGPSEVKPPVTRPKSPEVVPSPPPLAVAPPPPPSVVVEAPPSVQMGRRATFRVVVAPTPDACAPAVDIAPGAPSEGGSEPARLKKQDGPVYTFVFDVPYDEPLYGLGVRYRARCAAPDGRTARYPGDGSWRPIRAAL